MTEPTKEQIALLIDRCEDSEQAETALNGLLDAYKERGREAERLRIANERLRSIYGCKCEEVVRRAEQTEARLARVVERHVPILNAAGDEVCAVCGVYWPCGERRHYDSLAQPEEGGCRPCCADYGQAAERCWCPCHAA